MSQAGFILRLGVGLLGALLNSATLGGSVPAGIGVRDLHYGEALFQLFQQRNFTAITHLQMAQAKGAMTAQGDEPELVLGGLYLAYGLYDEAEQLFMRLLEKAAKPAVRDRAWFQLARLHQQQGRPKRAAAAFARIGDALPDTLHEQQRELAGLIAMAQGDHPLAVQRLMSPDGRSAWQGFHLFNRALAQLGQGSEQEGRDLLDQLAGLDADDEEHRALRDRANLLHGQLLLEAGENAAAQERLQQVRLQGLHSNQALLALGWASFRQDQFEEALTPWMALALRDPDDPAVQQGLLLAPQALQQLGAEAEALKRYRQALKFYQAELAELGLSLQAVAKGVLLPDLSMFDGGGAADGLLLASDPDQRRRLRGLLAKHRFRQAYDDYVDVGFLSANLHRWSSTIETYDHMLEVRQAAYAEQLPRVEAALSDQRLQGLRQRREKLLERQKELADNRLPLRLANAEEQAQLARMQAIEAKMDQMGDAVQLEAKRQRLRLMKGILHWQVETDFKPRLWQFSKSLRSAGDELEQSRQLCERLQVALEQAPSRFEGFSGRIESLKARIAELQASVNVTLKAQAGALNLMASESLQQRRQGLEALQVRTRFALAQLQDRAAARNEAGP
ncbi:MAG: tetratricopeptide repeat protein [gamma proteobacterium endosymbiont of Lamellibrachia anaximandri]|nr:tetratricopeptide repeat protein [gamma proteobacterium endosymbiont of Lamellibrachia anaximandri]MBL3616569.1 tetratricopeptide repeat protein [gamma proteobacterium endosymbiont of Lamellibrachia anaximandri]